MLILHAQTSKNEVLQMPSATDVNLGYGFISPIYCSKAKKVILFYYKVFYFFFEIQDIFEN